MFLEWAQHFFALAKLKKIPKLSWLLAPFFPHRVTCVFFRGTSWYIFYQSLGCISFRGSRSPRAQVCPASWARRALRTYIPFKRNATVLLEPLQASFFPRPLNNSFFFSWSFTPQTQPILPGSAVFRTQNFPCPLRGCFFSRSKVLRTP